MRHFVVLASLHIAACSFTPSGASDNDGAVDVDADVTIDASPDIDAAPHDIAHVIAADESLGTADLALSTDDKIDTGSLTFGATTLPTGVELVAVAQDGGGP